MLSWLSAKYNILENETFKKYWGSILFYRFGSALLSLIFPWIVLTLTGSYLQLGGAFAVTGLPWVVAQPLAGFYTDRLSRKRIMIISSEIEMLVTVAVPIFHYFGLLNIIVVYLTMVAHSFTSVFFLSARFAVLPTIVGDSRLDEANSLLYISFPIIGALSIISGGTVAEFVGIAPPFLVSSVTFLVATIYLTNCNIPSSNKKSQGIPKLSKIATELKADLTEGVEEILRVKIVKRLIFYSFLINIFNVAFPQSIAAIGWGFFGSALLYGTLRVSFQGGQVLGSYLVKKNRV